MVLIDGKKFACSACVKGHRSTSCAHIDRTLIEIGKKGRPPTQCSHCRELRKTSKVHSKCMCGDKPTKKARHITVLPNGVADLATPLSSQVDPISALLSSCSCSLGGKCCCSAPPHSTISIRATLQKMPRQLPTPRPSSHQPNPATPPSTSSPPEPKPSRSSCCSSGRQNSLQAGLSVASPQTEPLPQNITIHTYEYPTQSVSHSSQVSSPLSSSTLSPFSNQSSTASAQNYEEPPSWSHTSQDALFAPRTAGTVLCFCGIHCPCPGCLLHDPLGLKFPQNSEGLPPCPTTIRRGEGCIGGLDLPMADNLLNLSPIVDQFGDQNTNQHGSDTPRMNLPSVSEAFAMNDWNPADGSGNCCGGIIPQDSQEPDLRNDRRRGCCGSNGSSSSTALNNFNRRSMQSLSFG